MKSIDQLLLAVFEAERNDQLITAIGGRGLNLSRDQVADLRAADWLRVDGENSFRLTEGGRKRARELSPDLAGILETAPQQYRIHG